MNIERQVQQRSMFVPWSGDGKISGIVPLADAAAAFARVAERGKRGKVVLRVADD